MPERVDDEGSSSQYGSVDALTPLAKQESQRKPSKNPKNYPIITRRRSSLEVYRTFFGEFHRSKGSWLIVLLGFLTALGLGSLVGVVPQILTQRYAEELFGYGDDTTKVNSGAAAAAAALCNSFTKTDTAVPTACVQGANYAQSGASYCALAKNALAFLTNSVAGSYSDRHGRRDVQILFLALISLPPMALLLLQTFHNVPPNLYFVVDAFTGIINMFSISFTQLSDSLPHHHRAAAYGVYFGAFMFGIAVAPYLATVMSHVQVTIAATCIRILALLIAILFLPETLGGHERAKYSEGRDHNNTAYDSINLQGKDGTPTISSLVLRPLLDMKILLRNRSLVLVALGAFLSKMVFSADITLFFFYIENNLGATDHDVARMMFATGIVGLVVQAGLLKYLVSLLGERSLLIVSFYSGAAHNLIYGFAPNIFVIYFGMCLSQLSNTNGPLLSSLASRSVAITEQGQIQGALFSLTSVAEAIGPICLNFVYRHWHIFGSGTMFVLGSFLYILGAISVSFVPPKQTDVEDCEGYLDESNVLISRA